MAVAISVLIERSLKKNQHELWAQINTLQVN